MNEELQTVNSELKSKLETVGAAHSDLRNLVAATDVGTLFLDPKLRIRMFTPRVSEIFNISEVDTGRSITDFTHRMMHETLAEDAREVLSQLATVEHEVRTRDGRWLMVRLRPYRTLDDRIDGVVVTFVDITERRRADRRLRESEERHSFLLRLSDAIRPLRDAADIEGETCRLLAEWLGADRAYYVALDEDRGVARVESDYVRGGAASLEGEHPIAAFQWSVDILRRDECHVVGDTRSSLLVPDEDREASVALGIISCMGAPILKGGSLVGALCVTGSKPRDWTDVEVEVLRDVADRLWATIERARVGRALRESEAKYRRLFDSMDEGYLLASVLRDEAGKPVDMLYHEANPAATRLVGVEFAGKRLSEIGEGFEEHWWTVPDAALSTGEPQHAELWAGPLGKWFDIGVTRIDDDRIAILFRDVTERKRHERERDLLVSELNHRVKNMLAVVASVASQTMRTTSDLGTFGKAFLERIQSLSRAHQVLTQSNWEGADLRDLVERTVSHFLAGEDDRSEIRGESVFLGANAALSLSMALHELGTNALKYGAWSAADGRVRISWRQEGYRVVVLDWEEQGGPEVSPPDRKGFGTRLLERGIARELGGRVSVEFNKHGLRCRIEFDRRGNGGTSEPEASGGRG